MITTEVSDTITLEPITPVDAGTDADVSRLALAWQVDAGEVDIWAGVQAAIAGERPHPAAPYVAKTVAELSKQVRENDAAVLGKLFDWFAQDQVRSVTLPQGDALKTARSYYQHVANSLAKTVDVRTVQPTPEALTALPADVARAYFALPLSKDNRNLYVAFADPADADAIEAVSLASDSFVQPLRADRDALAVAIALAYAPRPAEPVDAVRLASAMYLRPALAKSESLKTAISQAYATWSDDEKATGKPNAAMRSVATEMVARSWGVPYVDLNRHSPEPDAVATVLADFAQKHQVLPIKKDGNRLWLAMQNPRSLETVDAARLMSRCLVQPILAEPEALAEAINKAYGSAPPTNADESGEFADYLAGRGGEGEPSPLTKEQEQRLALHVEQGKKWAREVLVNANLRVVTLVAKRYQNRGIATEDLIQEGTLGLIHAVDKFDYRRGFRFSTYATHWIRQALGRAVENQGRTIRLPSHAIESLGKIKRTREMLATKLNRTPTPAEIALEVGLPVERVELLLEADATSTASSDAAKTLLFANTEAIQNVRDAVLSLTPEQGRVLDLHLRSENVSEAMSHLISGVEAIRSPPAPPNPPTAIAAPAPEPTDDTRALLREMLTELRETKRELVTLRAEVAELQAARSGSVPRPSTARLFPFAPLDRRTEP